MSPSAAGGPNQVVSASPSPRSEPSRTQATCPARGLNQAPPGAIKVEQEWLAGTAPELGAP
jgi:hypothetical protein